MKSPKNLPRPREDIVGAAALKRVARGLGNDPFAVLGLHPFGDGWVARVNVPDAIEVSLINGQGNSTPATLHASGIFEVYADIKPKAYQWKVTWRERSEIFRDPYLFDALISEHDLEAFRDGRLLRPSAVLGSHCREIDGAAGVSFAVWAPHAQRVSVLGDFNDWDGRRHPLRLRHTAGVWEIFIPGVAAGASYKYELLDADGQLLPPKADPMARLSELPPASASVVTGGDSILWHDAIWLENRLEGKGRCTPMSIYEVHATSWHHDEQGWLDWYGLAATLVPYVQNQGFTHIEFLPLSEHPFGGSWGYQPIGLYAPTARLGSPEGFAHFVDSCHVAGIGVIVDWVSAHFPDDAHGLRRFDGTALYEHADPREGVHQDWQTSIYNYGRNEVRCYLIGSALDWIERFHVDGLRVDAVASMLYRDYSRTPGEWIPNALGGRENFEAVAFIRELNETIAKEAMGVMVIAEESTAWPGVCSPVSEGGLGFSHKWNMGWMHDTLEFMQRDPVHRRYHSDELTFGLQYAWSEHFILPLSHDEVAHGKGSLLSQMPGDRWQKFANLKTYYGFMWGHPGKKLLFMGGEFAQWREWSHDQPLDWHLLSDPSHRGMFQLVADLNRLLQEEPALHREDVSPSGFQWVFRDVERSIYGFVRSADNVSPVVVICNFTPEPCMDYRVGVAHAGEWREICNTDSAFYGGSNLGNGGMCFTEDVPSHGHPRSLRLVIPPLATIFLRPEF